MKGLVGIAVALSLFLPVSFTHAEEPLSIEEVYAIICQPQYLWNCETMVSIAWPESNYIPTATNYDCYPNHINPITSKPYICVGLLQVMEIHVPDWTALWNPWYCVEVAYKLWLDRNMEPWGK